MRFKTLKESVNWDDFDKFRDIIRKYVPDRGEGETMASQAATAINKLIYKWYNDGDVYDNRYLLQGWANDLSSYANWLYEYIPQTRDILDRIEQDTDNTYSDTLMLLAEKVLTPEFLNELESRSKVNSIYEAEGPFEFIEDRDYDEDDDYDYEDEYDEEADFDYYGDDTFGESLRESSKEVEDISHLIFDNRYGNKRVEELDVSPFDKIDHYYKLIKTVDEAEKFNYHSDYWGYDEDYQEQNIELIDALAPYINKTVEIEYEDGLIRGKLLGIAIDRQYNSISHTKVILDTIEEVVEESLNETAELDKKVKVLKQKITKLDDYGYKNGYDINVIFDGIKDTVENHLMKYRDELAVIYDSPEFFEEDRLDLDEALGLNKDKKSKVCVICDKEYEGYGNNAEPVAKGQCCDECNTKVVIPARLKNFMKKRGLKENYSSWLCKYWPDDKDDRAQLDRKLRYLNLKKELTGKDALIKGDKENIERFMLWLGLTSNRFSEIKEESLKEDTIKQNGKWVNKGKEGTHGIFKTKKAADAQRKAMFANGFKK